MDKLKQIQEKIATLQAKSAVAPELKAFATLFLKVLAEAKSDFSNISKENQFKIDQAFAYLEQEHDKLKDNVSQETEKAKKELNDTLAEARNFLEEVKNIKTIPGKDGENGIDGVDGKDGKDGKDGSPDNREQIVTKINSGKEKDTKIEAKQITGLPDFTREVIREVGGGFTETPLKAGANITITKDASGAHVITGSAGGGTSDHSLLTNLDYASAGHTGFQEALISGTNIKTVNGTSLLGSGDVVISGGTIDGSGTSNELTYWVDTDTLGTLAVATYPSLTELSYVKGVTSTIQTQLDSKAPTANPTFTGEVTIPNTGLHILDTNGSHDLIIKPGSNINADRTLTITTGNADTNLDLTAVTDEYVLAYDTGTNTWRGVAVPSSGITIGSTTITSGTDTRVLFDDGGVVGEDAGLTYAKSTDILSTVGGYNVSSGGAYKYNSVNVIRALTSLNSYFFANAGNLTATNTDNYAIGNSSMSSLTSGAGNVGIGTNTLQSNTDGNYNVALGYNTLRNGTSITGNMALGAFALNSTTANDNIGVGYQALEELTSGANNLAMGTRAGRRDPLGNSNATGAGGVFLGNDTKPSANGNSNEIVIGYSAVGNGTNTATLGSSSITKTILQGVVSFGGGITSSYPALKRSSTELQVRLADDSGYAPLAASQYEIGNASDTTLTRVSAGVASIEGARIITSTGTTSGTILKNNGTTFVASTETYAAPGTSGNVMTSDGTNWTSAAPAGGGDVYALTAKPTTYYTYTIPFFARSDAQADDNFSGWTMSGYTTGSEGNGFYAKLVTTGGNSFMYTHDNSSGGIPGTGSTEAIAFNSSKKIVFSCRYKGDSSGNWCVGIGTNTNDNWYTTSTTSSGGDRAVFGYDGSTFYSITDSGTTVTRNSIAATVTDWMTLRIEFDPSSEVRFYLNGSLAQTHTTNLPNGGNVLIGSGHSTTGRTYRMTSPTISVEL